MPSSRGGVLALLAVSMATTCTQPAATPAAPSTSSSTPPPTPESFTLVATGDVLIHQDRALTAGARQHDGSYDFTGVLAGVAPLIAAADLAVCHLEAPVAPPGGPYRGYPSFAVQPEIVDALAGAGYDVCSTASNHSLDDGTDGLVRTLDLLAAAGIASTGTYRSQAESLEPRIVDVGGIGVGHVAATYGLNGVPLPAGRAARPPGRRRGGAGHRPRVTLQRALRSGWPFHRPPGSSCVHPALADRRHPDPGAGRDHGDAGAEGRRDAAQGSGRRGRRPRGRHW